MADHGVKMQAEDEYHNDSTAEMIHKEVNPVETIYAEMSPIEMTVAETSLADSKIRVPVMFVANHHVEDVVM